MKNKILIILLLLCHFGLARALEKIDITLKSDKNKSFIVYTYKQAGEEIADLCLIDPGKIFNFFSVESDSMFFKRRPYYTENHLDSLSRSKKLGPISCVIMADMKKTGLSFSFSYFWESIGIIVAADPYLVASELISPAKSSTRYFFEVTLNNKKLYCLIALKQATPEKAARQLITLLSDFKSLKFKLIPISNFPIKMLSYDNNKKIVIYESHNGHKYYSCLYISNKK